MKLAPSANLGRGFAFEAEAKNEIVHDRDLDQFVRRREFAGTQLRYAAAGNRVSALLSWEGRFEYALHDVGLEPFGGDRSRSENALSAGAEWRPDPHWDVHGRAEYQEERDVVLDETVRRTRSYRQAVAHRPTRDLEWNAALEFTDLEDLRKIGVVGSGQRRRDTEAQLDGNYNHGESLSLTAGFHIHRREIFDPEGQETWVHRLFAGMNGHLHRRVEATFEAHYAWLDGRPLATDIETIDNTRLRLLGEISWDVRRWTRLALGHEQVDYREDSTPDGENDFEAGRTYLKWIARL